MKHFWPLAFSLTLPSSLLSCGASTSEEAPKPLCHDAGAMDLQTPMMSFRTDILPTLRQSCGLSQSCHGLSPPTKGQPYLGPAVSAPTPTNEEVAQLLAGVVDAASTAEPAMSLVTPLHPKKSFLMYKIDGSTTCEALTCAADASCGDSMPPGVGSDTLLTFRNNMRRWIAQGARDN